MADESDGIEEALESTVRLAAITAARVGSEIARARQEQRRHQQLSNEARERQLSARFQGEKHLAMTDRDALIDRTAVTSRNAVTDPDRVGRSATTERVFRIYAFKIEADSSDEISKDRALQILEALPADATMPLDGRGGLRDVQDWRGIDPEVDEAIARKFPHLTSRTGQPPSRLSGDLATSELDAARQSERQSQTDTKRESLQAVGLLAEAENSRRSLREYEAGKARPLTEPTYDSAERRAGTAQALERNGVDPDVVASRMYADTGTGTPATQATTGASRGKAPKVRTARGQRGAQIDKTGVER